MQNYFLSLLLKFPNTPSTNKEVDYFDEFDPRGPVSGIENPRGFLFANRCSLTLNNFIVIVSIIFYDSYIIL